MTLKHLLPIALTAAIMAPVFTGCDSDTPSNWEKYAEWRHFNQNWLAEMSNKTNPDGTPYYKTILAPWDPSAFVLMHTFPSDTDNSGNLKPLFTSTTKVNYSVYLANDSLIDKATGFVSTLNNSGYISGWSLAIMEMNVGDSAEFIMPYTVGYGEDGYGLIPPYSDLRYNIRLTDIPYYEIRP